jgi:hypothetical protein
MDSEAGYFEDRSTVCRFCSSAINEQQVRDGAKGVSDRISIQADVFSQVGEGVRRDDCIIDGIGSQVVGSLASSYQEPSPIAASSEHHPNKCRMR